MDIVRIMLLEQEGKVCDKQTCKASRTAGSEKQTGMVFNTFRNGRGDGELEEAVNYAILLYF